MAPLKDVHFVFAIVTFSILASSAFSQDEIPVVCSIEGRVIDEAGNPIRNAFLMQRTVSDTDATVPLEMLVNEDGTFRMQAPVKDASSFGLYVVAPGYATREFNQYNLHGRPIEAVLKPDEKLAVQVVSPDGKPIQGAMVCLNGAGFPINRALRQRLGQRTNKNGEAELSGFSLKNFSVQADVPGYGTLHWHLPERVSEKRIWKLVCPRHRASLQVNVIDHAGVPVHMAYVTVSRPSEEVNESVIQDATLYFSTSQQTPESGEVFFDNIVSDEVEVSMFVKANRVTQLCKTSSGKKSNVVMQLPKLAPVVISLVAPKELSDLSGIRVQFSSTTRSGGFQATTDEDGIIETQLGPGDWSYYPTGHIPEGYAFCGAAATVTVDASLEVRNPIPIYLSKARLIEGKILGVDFVREPYNWLLVENKKYPDSEMQPAGRIDREGTFKLWVAEDVMDDELINFQTPVHERGTFMEVVSKSPWILTPRKAPAETE